MNTPQPDFKLPPDLDFICVAFTLPVDTAIFMAAFADGGSKIKYIPAGWKFILCEPQETCCHALFKVEFANMKELAAQYAIIKNLIRKAYRR